MIDHRYKFVHVHIPKCGGSSIESFFGYDLWDKERFPGAFYSRDLMLGKDPQTKRFLQHSTLQEIITNSPEFVRDYFSFTFVRNPWSRQLSDFVYYKKRRRNKQFYNSLQFHRHFKKFLRNKQRPDPSHYIPQVDYIRDRTGKVIVDHIARFENLQADFNIICDKLNIPPEDLPVKNKSTYTKTDYTQYYDSESRKIIENIYAEDIDHFGYKFGA